jgi:dTDP-4-amino-4,6-dideoxygalactose transaminase
VFLADPALRLKIELALRNNGVISDPLRYQYRPLYEMPLFATYVKRCLNAEKLMQSVFTVPVHEAISQEDMEYFTFIIKEVNHD